MSVQITSVEPVDSRNFTVNGATSPGQLTVTCQAFIGDQLAGPASSGQSGTNGSFSIGVTLNSDYSSNKTYTFRATDQKLEVNEMNRSGPLDVE
jgi:hypothetical protein